MKETDLVCRSNQQQLKYIISILGVDLQIEEMLRRNSYFQPEEYE